MKINVINVCPAALLGLLAASAGMAAAKGDDSQIRAEITAKYHTVDVGLAHKNTKALAAVLTPDFTFVDGKSTINREKALQLINMEFTASQSMSSDPTIITSFKIENGNAIIGTKSSSSITEVDPQGKKHKILERNATVDTWVKTKNGWNMKKTVIKSETASIDGKPFTGLGSH